MKAKVKRLNRSKWNKFAERYGLEPLPVPPKGSLPDPLWRKVLAHNIAAAVHQHQSGRITVDQLVDQVTKDCLRTRKLERLLFVNRWHEERKAGPA
ncbi:MAG: hypothetical protein SFU83_23515 [Meiothermus sp.]|nr:hypothetical protein [Meiothermus sp.]